MLIPMLFIFAVCINASGMKYNAIVSLLRHLLPRTAEQGIRCGGGHGLRKAVQRIGSNVIGGVAGGAAVEGASQFLTRKRMSFFNNP